MIYADIVEDDKQVCEDWEFPNILTYNKIDKNWYCSQTEDNTGQYGGFLREEILTKNFSYKMLPNNEREECKTTYILNDGVICESYDELVDYFNSVSSSG